MTTKEHFKEFVIRECRKYGIEWQNFDVEEYYHPEQNLEENKRIFKKILGMRINKVSKDEYNEKIKDLKQKQNLKFIDEPTDTFVDGGNENGDFNKFLKIFEKSDNVITILGKRRSGKTALMFRMIEEFRKKFKIYSVNYPKNITLPCWIENVRHITSFDYQVIFEGMKRIPSLKDVKNGTVFLDESEEDFIARRSMNKEALSLSKILSLCGQNKNNLIFTTQNSSLIDINILRHSNMILLKEPSFMQISGITEKPAIKKLYDECIDIFEELKARNEPLEPYFFVWSENFRGMVRFDLPACWTDKLAHASDAFLSCSE